MAKVKVEGVRQLRVTVGNLVASLEQEERSTYGRIAYEAMAEASAFAWRAIRSMATANGWPRASIDSIFWYGSLKREYNLRGAETGFSRRLRASLVGVRKGAPPRYDDDIYREWRASPNNKSPNRKRSGGQTIGMSLAAMYEFGTTKMAARPAFRPAYQASKAAIRKIIIEGYREIIRRANRQAA